MTSIGIPELMVVVAICAVTLVTIWPTGRICRRAGFSSWLGVLAVVPIANVLLLWYLAYAAWPASGEAGR